MENKLQMKGLWVPIVTTFINGQLDQESMLNVIRSIEPFVDGIAACLSTGEGGKMDDQLWTRTLKLVAESSSKPVMAGIINRTPADIIRLSAVAEGLGCVAIAVPFQGATDQEREEFFKTVSDGSALPIMVYNTEAAHTDSLETMEKIASYENIVAIKDSSRNQKFFDSMTEAKKKGLLNISLFQGIEIQLITSHDFDGCVVGLGNTEPELCRDLFYQRTPELAAEMKRKCDRCDINSKTWYLNLKQVLVERGTIKSASPLP